MKAQIEERIEAFWVEFTSAVRNSKMSLEDQMSLNSRMAEQIRGCCMIVDEIREDEKIAPPSLTQQEKDEISKNIAYSVSSNKNIFDLPF